MNLLKLICGLLDQGYRIEFYVPATNPEGICIKLQLQGKRAKYKYFTKFELNQSVSPLSLVIETFAELKEQIAKDPNA